MVLAGASIENSFDTNAISCAAISESPPTSKKLSWSVSRVTPNTRLKMASRARWQLRLRVVDGPLVRRVRFWQRGHLNSV